MTHYDFPRVLQPTEAAALRLASLKAVRALGGRDQLGDKGREQLVRAMMSVARSGYARSVDGTIDPDMLAEAAIVRFRAMTEA